MTLKTRNDFPQLLNSLELTGVGVEVGVHEGSFSEHILDNWNGRELISIDPWTYQPEVKMDKSNVEQAEHNRCYSITQEKLRRFGKRSVILRTFSPMCTATHFIQSRAPLSFVYLDARHDYRSVANDLFNWWPLIEVGGIIAGHDFKNSFVRKNLVEVERAVRDFFYEPEIQTTTEDNIPTWYVRKVDTHCQTIGFCHICGTPEHNCLCSHED
jgi:hypothetical protein